MKTTLDLPDDLLIEAKSLAARRKTTLKAVVESALRREIRPVREVENPNPDKLELGPFGILRLKRLASGRTTMKQTRAVQAALDGEDLCRVMNLKGHD